MIILAITLIIFSFLCWAFAALCNSIMDTITHHWWNCIFHSDKYNEAFWNPDYKGPIYMIPHTKYKVNAWHLFKSAMVFLFSFSNIAMFVVGTIIQDSVNIWVSIIILLIMYGILWNTPFNLFYNKYLLKKNERN